MAEPRLKGRVALITGASRGIGAAVARRYAAEGAMLVLLARTVGGLEEVDDQVRSLGGQAVLVPLDLKDSEAIDRLGPALAERFGKLDIFVGNAGVLGELRPLTHYTPDLWADAFAINVHANWRLLRALDPLLRRAEAGRVILVTSRITQSLRAYWGAYAASKAALEAMARIYANELKQTNLKVNLLDPVAVATRMRAEAYPGEDPKTLKQPDEITELFVRLAEASFAASGERFSVCDA
ncbi:MAG: SDR family NAD(P)-dependent oxidoreductase [Alphaproteobacteria bacterium]|nr:SDR family NAD(P)-dependent oxidoreductase [Alphaproteobacteria bacterium]